MAQSKQYKLKEYFTNIITHEAPANSIHPHLNKYMSERNLEPRKNKDVKSCSPIRYNDTNRSRILEGDYVLRLQNNNLHRDRSAEPSQITTFTGNSPYNSSRCVKIDPQSLVDQQASLKKEFRSYISFKGSTFKPKNGRDISQSPTKNKVDLKSSSLIHQKTAQEYSQVKENRGMVGMGTKSALNFAKADKEGYFPASRLNHFNIHQEIQFKGFRETETQENDKIKKMESKIFGVQGPKKDTHKHPDKSPHCFRDFIKKESKHSQEASTQEDHQHSYQTQRKAWYPSRSTNPFKENKQAHSTERNYFTNNWRDTSQEKKRAPLKPESSKREKLLEIQKNLQSSFRYNNDEVTGKVGTTCNQDAGKFLKDLNFQAPNVLDELNNLNLSREERKRSQSPAPSPYSNNRKRSDATLYAHRELSQWKKVKNGEVTPRTANTGSFKVSAQSKNTLELSQYEKLTQRLNQNEKQCHAGRQTTQETVSQLSQSSYNYTVSSKGSYLNHTKSSRNKLHAR